MEQRLKFCCSYIFQKLHNFCNGLLHSMKTLKGTRFITLKSIPNNIVFVPVNQYILKKRHSLIFPSLNCFWKSTSQWKEVENTFKGLGLWTTLKITPNEKIMFVPVTWKASFVYLLGKQTDLIMDQHVWLIWRKTVYMHVAKLTYTPTENRKGVRKKKTSKHK